MRTGATPSPCSSRRRHVGLSRSRPPGRRSPLGGRDQPRELLRAAAPRPARSRRSPRGRPTRWRRGCGARSESCAPQSTNCGVRVGGAQLGHERDRAAAAHPRHRLAEGLLERPLGGARRRAARSASTPARPRSRSARPTARARACGARRPSIERTGSAPGGTRTAILARACGITMLPAPSTAGASRPRTEIAWRAHRRSASVAGADQLRRRRARRPGGGSRPRATRRRPSRRPAGLRRRRCRRRRAGVAIRRREREQRVGRGAAEVAAVQRAAERAQRDRELAVAAQGLRERRLAHLPVAVVGDHHHVGAHQLGLARRRPAAAPGARSPRSPRSATFTCTGGLPPSARSAARWATMPDLSSAAPRP